MRIIALIIITLSLSIFTSMVHAQNLSAEETFEAKIVAVQEISNNLVLEAVSGSSKGKRLVVPQNSIPTVSQPEYQVGDMVIVSYSQDVDGQPVYYITDSVRRMPLLILFIIFVVCAVVIAKWRGIMSLVGMALSFLIIFQFILPQIMAGNDPVVVAIIGSLIIIPVTFYLSHGFNQKTTVAVIGTLITLIVTGLMAVVFVNTSKLTGFASEEAAFVQAQKPGVVNIKGLLLAGIIIGVLGILDDVSVSQSSIVRRLKKANPKLTRPQLFSHAMDVGRDHISSMVNTLILVYTGASLPLLLLFVDTPRPFFEIINYEIIADEIVKTLVGSIGLMLTVPVTTAIAAAVFGKKDTNQAK